MKPTVSDRRKLLYKYRQALLRLQTVSYFAGSMIEGASRDCVPLSTPIYRSTNRAQLSSAQQRAWRLLRRHGCLFDDPSAGRRSKASRMLKRERWGLMNLDVWSHGGGVKVRNSRETADLDLDFPVWAATALMPHFHYDTTRHTNKPKKQTQTQIHLFLSLQTPLKLLFYCFLYSRQVVDCR